MRSRLRCGEHATVTPVSSVLVVQFRQGACMLRPWALAKTLTLLHLPQPRWRRMPRVGQVPPARQQQPRMNGPTQPASRHRRLVTLELV